MCMDCKCNQFVSIAVSWKQFGFNKDTSFEPTVLLAKHFLAKSYLSRLIPVSARCVVKYETGVCSLLASQKRGETAVLALSEERNGNPFPQVLKLLIVLNCFTNLFELTKTLIFNRRKWGYILDSWQDSLFNVFMLFKSFSITLRHPSIGW